MKRRVWIGCLAPILLSVAPIPTVQAQPASDVAVLREIVAEVESGRRIILAPYGTDNTLGTLAVVERDRVESIAVWLVLNGWVDPDDVGTWTRQQLAASKTALEILKRQLSEL